MSMTEEEFDELFKKCYNPSITQFKKEDTEDWSEEAPDFLEECNYVDSKKDLDGE